MKKTVEETPEAQPDPDQIKMRVVNIEDRLNDIDRSADLQRWQKHKNADNALYVLQVACWVIMLVGASLVAARALKQFKNSR